MPTTHLSTPSFLPQDTLKIVASYLSSPLKNCVTTLEEDFTSSEEATVEAVVHTKEDTLLVDLQDFTFFSATTHYL